MNSLKLFFYCKTTVLLMVSTLAILAFSASAQSPSQIDRLTQQWLDTERQALNLESEWKQQQPLLEQRLALLTEEKKQLQAMLQQNHAGQDDVDSRRASLLAEQAALESQQGNLEQSLSLLQSRVESIRPLLPPPLISAWQTEQDSLNENAETSQRMQVALAQLAKAADFDSRVSVHEAPIETEDGQTTMVKQFYLGLGMAWFTSNDGQVSGWGQADKEGWRWHFDSDLAASDVALAIDIFEKKRAAELVRLPVQLVNDVAGNTFENNNSTSAAREAQP